MKFLLLAILVVSAFTLKLEGATRATQKQIDELAKSKWGQTMLNMIELHTLAGNIVDELIQGIEDLIADLNDQLEELDFNYNVRTNEHNAMVMKLEQDISDAVIDIQRSDDVLENLLKPRRKQLKTRITQLQAYQGENRKALQETTLVRAQQHEQYEQLVGEYNDATDAVDQALQLLGTLNNPSMLQIKKFHHALRKIEARIRTHTEHSTLIKALIALAASQNFSNQEMLGEIVAKLNEFRSAVVDALNDLTATEAENQAAFEERVADLNSEHAEFGRQIALVTVDLTAVQDKIQELTAFIASRDADRRTFTAQLELENELYAQETDIYQNLRAEYLRELAVSEQGLSLVQNADFSGLKI